MSTYLFFNNTIALFLMSRAKQSLVYLLIVVLLGIIYQNPFCCNAAYSQETELKYVKQIGMKGLKKDSLLILIALQLTILVTFSWEIPATNEYKSSLLMVHSLRAGAQKETIVVSSWGYMMLR